MLNMLALLVRLLLILVLISLFVPAAILGLIANSLAGALIATADWSGNRARELWADQ